MIKAIKFQTDGTSSNTRRKGNFLVGESTVAYGPTTSTGLYNSIIPPEGGYTLYLNKASGGPSIYVFNNNQELIDFCNNSLGANQTTIFNTIDWINGENDKYVDPGYFHFTAEIISAGSFQLPIESENNPNINCDVDWGDGASSAITSSGYASHTYPSTGSGGGGSETVIYEPYVTGELVTFDANPSRTIITLFDFYNFSLPTINNGDVLTIETDTGGTYEITMTNVYYSSVDMLDGEGTSPGPVFISSYQVTKLSVSGGGGGIPVTYDIKIAGQISNLLFAGYQMIKDIKSWGCLNISLPSTFQNCQSMECTAVDSPRITTTDFSELFNSCVSFNGSIGNWDVSNVTNMYNMFNSAQSFNQDINNWDISNVTDMGYMFAFTNNFNQDISKWDTSNVTNMELMFNGAQSFNQDISNWNIEQVTDLGGFMRNVTLSTINYDQLLIKWNNELQSTYPGGVGYPSQPYTIEYGSSKYSANSAASAARTSLVNTFGWTITDGGSI